MIMDAAYLQLSSFVALLIAFQIVVAHVQLEREAKRRWQHALTGHAMVQISYYIPQKLAAITVLLAAAGIYFLRVHHSELLLKAIGPLLRPSELDENRLPGAFYFLLGTAVTLLLFPMDICQYAVECLAFCDPLAAWMGQSFPSRKIVGNASISGSLGCFVSACIIGLIFFSEGDLEDSRPVRILGGALACTVAEALPFGNDNIQIPILTSAAVYWL